MNLRSAVIVNSPLVLGALVLGALAACNSQPALDDAKLEGLGVRNLAQPQPGLLTAGQPSQEQFEAMAELGIQRFINLRTEGENGTGWEAEAAKKLGVDYVHIPIGGADAINEENAKRLAEALDGAPATLLYCGSSNRVGALLGLKARVCDGMTIEQARELGKAAGATRLAAVLDERLEATAGEKK